MFHLSQKVNCTVNCGPSFPLVCSVSLGRKPRVPAPCDLLVHCRPAACTLQSTRDPQPLFKSLWGKLIAGWHWLYWSKPHTSSSTSESSYHLLSASHLLHNYSLLTSPIAQKTPAFFAAGSCFCPVLTWLVQIFIVLLVKFWSKGFLWH